MLVRSFWVLSGKVPVRASAHLVMMTLRGKMLRGSKRMRPKTVTDSNSMRISRTLLFFFLDASLSKASSGLKANLDTSDLNKFWYIFWTTVEDAVACFTQADCGAAKRFRGRATQLVRKTKTQGLAHSVLGDAIPSNLPEWLLAIRRQANKC